MEFLKEHHSQELVKEVLRISCDGNMVSMFLLASLLYKGLRVLHSIKAVLMVFVFIFYGSNYLFANAVLTYALLSTPSQ